jgi:hypothetical protein
MRAVLSILICTGALAGALWFVLWKPLQDANRILQDIEQSSARIAALHERLQERPAENNTPALPPDLIWKAQTRNEAELGLQRILLAKTEQAGLRIIRYGANGSDIDAPHPNFAIETEIEGPLGALYELFQMLDAHRPAIAVAALQIRAQRSSQDIGDIAVRAQITFWGFWSNDV